MPAGKGPSRNQAAKKPQFLVAWESGPRAFWAGVRVLIETWRAKVPAAAAAGTAHEGTLRPLLEWQSWPRSLWANLQALFQPGMRRAVIPTHLRTVRAAWFTRRFPWGPMAASVLLHVLLILMPIRFFSGGSEPQMKVLLASHELIWYNPSAILPPVAPFSEEKKQPSPGGQPDEPLPPQGAEAFHPRQTIVSNPPKPNNPLLTLQQPDLISPPEVKPKPLPNIVLWARSPLPPTPQLELAVKQIAPPKVTLPIPKPAELPANLEPRIGEINIARSAVLNLEPKLVVPPARTAVPGTLGEAAQAPAMNLPAGAGDVDRLQRIIALSASPAPLAPVIDVPPGNLAARFSVGPMGGQPGSPGGVAGGKPGAQGGTGGGPGGIAGGEGGALIHAPDVSVSAVPGAPPGLMGGASGPGGEMRPGGLAPAHPNPAEHEPRVIAHASLPRGGITGPEGLKPAPPGIEEGILQGRKVYTLSINMPNLASRSGSWVLRFSEREENSAEKSAGNGPVSELTAPVAVLKIDPKYSPEAVRAHIEGQVVLYAIIGKDGKVSSVQVVRGLDKRLDQNAVEAFRHWEFLPAKKAGVPVDLEAVVFIPFRLAEAF